MRNAILSFVIILTGFTITAAHASDTEKAEIFIRTLGKTAITALKQTEDNQPEREKQFETILNQNFDMDVIARFALGRYWNNFDAVQKDTYVRSFKDMVIAVYTKRFSEYTNQQFEVTGARPAGRDIIVNSFISTPGSPQKVRVDWRVRGGKVIDVIVEGVSMSVTQRSEFSSIIQRNGGDIEALITHLQKT
jgi:phospholipid transport system substrate-binding protein